MNLLLAQRFAQLRKEAGFSQEELAAKLGISRQAVSKWERGESSPDTDNLIALAKLYGVSLDALLLSENAPEVQETAQKENGPDEKIPFDSKPDAPAAQEETVEKIKPNLRQRIYQFLYPVYVPLMVLLYLLLGIVFHWWHPAWILFLTVPVFYKLNIIKILLLNHLHIVVLNMPSKLIKIYGLPAKILFLKYMTKHLKISFRRFSTQNIKNVSKKQGLNTSIHLLTMLLPALYVLKAVLYGLAKIMMVM